MYEKLTESLRKCGRLNMGDECICFHDGCCEAEPTCMYELMRKAADAIEELQHSLDIMNDANAKLRNQVPDWIPVTERLPKMRDAGILKKLGINLRSAKCLIVIRDGKDQIVDNDAELRDGKWHSDTLRWLSAGKKKFEVTHWMPLPKAPEEDKP